MNNFDKNFFQKFVAQWVNIKYVIHKHFIVIADKIIINYFLFVLFPSFLYYYSDRLKEIIPFFIFEIYLFIMFFKIIYDIFDWYNDVWIVTEDWVTDLDWALFSTNTVSTKYSSIEWIELVQDWIIDTILWKWDLMIHKIWWENFVLKNSSGAYKAIDIIDKYSKEVKDKEVQEQDLNQTIIDALSKVVKDYLENNHKNSEDHEKKDLIEKTKKIPWTIDLSND